jgi:hypothetical protein
MRLGASTYAMSDTMDMHEPEALCAQGEELGSPVIVVVVPPATEEPF